jgi:hypothetical protein
LCGAFAETRDNAAECWAAMDIVIHVRGERGKQLERLARDELRTPRDQAQKLFEDGLREEVRRRALGQAPAQDEHVQATSAA